MSIFPKINWEWTEEPTDHSFCCCCGEIIIGKMHLFLLFVDNVAVDKVLKYCEPCRIDQTKRD
jgi:hypothetical protein